MLPLIAVGFGMMTLGVALLCLGEVPLFRGKRIPAGRARLIGAILVGFLPLALLVRQASNALFGSDAVEGLAITWSRFWLCWITVFVLVLLVMRKKKEHPTETKSALPKDLEEVVFLEEERVTPKKLASKKAAPAPVKKKPAKPAAAEENPFDFS